MKNGRGKADVNEIATAREVLEIRERLDKEVGEVDVADSLPREKR